MSNGYTRGQLLDAVWRVFSANGVRNPPSRFTARAKKMLLLGVPLAAAEKPGQSGVDLEYTAYHAFELALALTLQDTGLKQAEIAFFIGNCRDHLAPAYARIMASPPAGRSPIPTEDRPNSPVRPSWIGKPTGGVAQFLEGSASGAGAPLADTSCFMSFRYIELTEAWKGSLLQISRDDPTPPDPFFLVPTFSWGIENYAREAWKLAWNMTDRVRIVVELSQLAFAVSSYLSDAPVVSRGRPKKSAN